MHIAKFHDVGVVFVLATSWLFQTSYL